MISHAISKETWSTAMGQPETDIILMQRIAAGDESALHELYSAFGQRLFAFALRISNDHSLAEDIVQDVLVIVWQTAGKYRGEGRVLAWLLGIVHNVALKKVRRRPFRISEELESILTWDADPPEEQTRINEKAGWVRKGLDSLSSEHRCVLELVFFQGLSLDEVARVCNCPLGTVKSRLSYARQHLRGVLDRRDKEDWL